MDYRRIVSETSRAMYIFCFMEKYHNYHYLSGLFVGEDPDLQSLELLDYKV